MSNLSGQTNLLEDINFIVTLQNNKETSKRIKDELEKSVKTVAELNQAREEFRGVAT